MDTSQWELVNESPDTLLAFCCEQCKFMMTSSNRNIFRVTGHLCEDSPVIGEFPAQRPVTRSFDVFFDLRPNKRLSKQSWVWWFETLLCPLWRQCNARRGQNYWATPISMSISITLTGMLIKLKFEAVSAITSSLEICIHYNRAYCRMSNGESLYTFYPRPVLAFGYCHRLRLCVCVCVSVWVSIFLVRAITQGQLKLGSSNLDQRCKTPMLSSVLFWGGNWPCHSRSNLT